MLDIAQTQYKKLKELQKNVENVEIPLEEVGCEGKRSYY